MGREGSNGTGRSAGHAAALAEIVSWPALLSLKRLRQPLTYRKSFGRTVSCPAAASFSQDPPRGIQGPTGGE